MRRVVGVDVGGTFTDLLLFEAGAGGGRVRLAKVPTTAANQADGVLAAIAEAGVAIAEPQREIPARGSLEGGPPNSRALRSPGPSPRRQMGARLSSDTSAKRQLSKVPLRCITKPLTRGRHFLVRLPRPAIDAASTCLSPCCVGLRSKLQG